MISRKTEDFTGYILQDEKKFYFHAINKVFYFISEGAGIFADLEEKKLVSPDYFWYGYTTDGYQLAVYTGEEEKKLGANYKIRPGVYVISKANAHRYDMSKFQAIEFVGGILNNLYPQERIETKYGEGNFIKKYPAFEQEYEVKIRETACKLVIKNVPSNTDPSIMDVIVRYEFYEEVPLRTISLVYNVVLDICRLLTNRKNIKFDEMHLFQIDNETGKWICFADGFIDFRYNIFTKKTYKNNILLSDMHDCMVELHKVVSSDAEGKSTYLFDFFAENDDDVYVFSDDKVKNICSSVECELDFVKDLKDEENENLIDLIKQVKKIIKEHRKSDKKLEDKTYDLIGSSLSHWGMANSRKIYLLYLKNKQYMDIYKNINNISCTEAGIETFVKYRNDITHGRYRTLDLNIVEVAYTLIALSYCSFFQRLGMQEADLKRLFEQNRIGW